MMAAGAGSSNQSIPERHTQAISFVVSGDANNIWAYYQALALSQTQIDNDLTRGGVAQGPLFLGQPTSGQDLLSFENEKTLPKGTTLALTKEGLPTFSVSVFTNQLLGVALSLTKERMDPSLNQLQWVTLRDPKGKESYQLIFKDILPVCPCSTPDLFLSGLTEVVVPFNARLEPEGELQAKVFINMDSSDEEFLRDQANLFSKLDDYTSIAKMYRGIPLFLSNFCFNGECLTQGLSHRNSPIASIESVVEDELQVLLAGAGKADGMGVEDKSQVLEFSLDFSVNAAPVLKGWLTDEKFEEQVKADAGRAGEGSEGNTYSDQATEERLKIFMHQGAIHPLIAFDGFFTGLEALGLFVGGGAIVASGRSGARDFYAKKEGNFYEISTETLSEEIRSPSSKLRKEVKVLDNASMDPVGILEFARGYMQLPVDFSSGQMAWGLKFKMSFNSVLTPLEIAEIKKALCQKLKDLYFEQFGSFLGKSHLESESKNFMEKIGFRVTRAMPIQPDDLALLIPESVPERFPPQPLVMDGNADGRRPPAVVGRHRLGEHKEDVAVDPAAAVGLLSTSTNNSPLVQPRPSVSKDPKVSFAKGAALMAGFLALFVIVAAVTHGVGVVPMLWGGLTLMSSLTGGAVGSASALAFLGIGGGVKACIDNKNNRNQSKPALALAAPESD